MDETRTLLTQAHDGPDYADETDNKPMSLMAWVYTAYACISTAAMMVLLRVWGQVAPSHAYFYSLSWAIGFCPFFIVGFLVVRYWYRQPATRLDGWRPILAQSTYVGLMYAINYWGVSTSNPHLAGPFQAVLSQLPVLFAMIFCSWLLKRRYPLLAWVGGVLVLVGATIPSVINANGSTEAKWILLFVAGNLPLGLLPVTFEAFHKVRGRDGRRITVEWRLLVTNATLAVWLLIFIPAFCGLGQPPFSEFDSNMRAAASCVFLGRGGLTGASTADTCSHAGPVLLATVIVAAAQQHSQVLLARYKTGLFATLAITVAPFLADAIFPIKAIMGDFAVQTLDASGKHNRCCTEVPSKWEGLGAAIALVGVVLYAYAEHTMKKKNVLFATDYRDLWFMKYFLD